MDYLADDWLIKSLTRYENVWMYELQDPTYSLSWMSDKELLVATTCANVNDGTGKNEISELALANKLFSASKQRRHETIMNSAKRDFAVQRGNLTASPVLHTATFPHTKCFASSGSEDGTVTLWQKEEGKGSFTRKATLSAPSPGVQLVASPAATTPSSKLLMAATDCCVRVYDTDALKSCRTLEQKTTASKPACSLSALSWLDGDAMFYTCQSASGSVSIFDTRLDQPRVTAIERTVCSRAETTCAQGATAADRPPGSACTATVGSAPASSNGSDSQHFCTAAFNPAVCTTLATCCSCGQVQIADVRYAGKESSTATLGACDLEPGQSEAVPRRAGIAGRLQLQFSPTNSDRLSVSGLDGTVQILSTKCIADTGSSDHGRSPVLFSHDGHVGTSEDEVSVRTLCHSWHPSEAELLFSAASDGSLHAWRPKLTEGAR